MEGLKSTTTTSFVDYESIGKNSSDYDKARRQCGLTVLEKAFNLAQTGVAMKKQTILDIGCGTGNYIVKLLKKVGWIEGLDLSQEMINKCKLKIKNETNVGELKKVNAWELEKNYKLNHFDALMINQVVQHIEIEGSTLGPRHGLKSMCRGCFQVLKKGGVVFISTRSKFPTYSDLYWYAGLAPEAVAKMEKKVPSKLDMTDALEEAGFDILFTTTSPKDEGIMHDAFFQNRFGPLSKAWRRGESFWSLVSKKELALVKSKILEMEEEGVLEDYVFQKDELRRRYGQVQYVAAIKK